MLCGLTIFYEMFPTFRLNMRNTPQHIVSPTQHCYGFEKCYERSKHGETHLQVSSCINNSWCWLLPKRLM